MKNLIFFIVLILLGTACKRYEEDEAFSKLHSKKKMIAYKSWKPVKYVVNDVDLTDSLSSWFGEINYYFTLDCHDTGTCGSGGDMNIACRNGGATNSSSSFGFDGQFLGVGFRNFSNPKAKYGVFGATNVHEYHQILKLSKTELNIKFIIGPTTYFVNYK